MQKPKTLLGNSTVLQCENCHLFITKSIIDAPKKCPGCKMDAVFSIVKISAEDSKYVVNFLPLNPDQLQIPDIG